MKVGFLFGAGAEYDYNMPSGGRFALDIFRQDTTEPKEEFKKMRDSIDTTSVYASRWLPEDYPTKNIGSYGKSVFETIIRDTIENNREKLIANLNDFDVIAASTADRLKKEKDIDVDAAFREINDRDVSDISMKQSVAFIDVFKDGNKIFDNGYFSSLLNAYRVKDSGGNHKIAGENRSDLAKILISIIQLQIGALGEKLSQKINDNLFKKKLDDVDIFDDIGELIHLDYRSTGIGGLEYLTDERRADPRTPDGVIVYFAQEVLESIFSSVLDYKSLIDSNWHYLYCPSAEWAKFCKISIFLLTVRAYIEKQCEKADVVSTRGYYHELKDAIDAGNIEPSGIATTNYTGLISDVLGNNVNFLNGSSRLWYDPYLNAIGDKEELAERDKHFIVPLLFTQSGTKPMTSIDMSMRYVDTYKAFRDADCICSVGFGFNYDDEHINGIIRKLVNGGKKLIVVQPVKHRPVRDVQKEIADKLKIYCASNVIVLEVDKYREHDGKIWTEALEDVKL